MLTYLLLIVTLYLAGNAYIFIRARQALKVKSLGAKILLTVLFWGCALSFFVTMSARNLAMPAFISHSMYIIGTSWLIFTLYMALFLLLFDILRLFKVVCKYRFYLSFVFTLGLLGYGVYNYHHPETNIVNILTNKQYVNAPQAYPEVRKKLVEMQKKFAKENNVVMDGRDIGTVVLPNAECKIYLTASSFVRANRRYKELIEKGETCDLAQIEKDIIARDEQDMNREIAPLKQAEDAVYLDSSDLSQIPYKVFLLWMAR